MDSPASSSSSSPTLSSIPLTSSTTSTVNMAAQKSSDPTKALAYLLNSMPPATFVSRLRAALDPSMGYTRDDVKAFLESLSNMGFERAVSRANEVAAKENQEELHCVRCHKAYLESENAMEACVVSHVRVFTSLGSSGNLEAGRCGSCNQGALPATVVQQPCIVARHTTNIDEIGGVKGGLVRSCEDEGCFNKAGRMVELCSRMEKAGLKAADDKGEENTALGPVDGAIFNFSKPMRPVKGLPSSHKKYLTTTSDSTKQAIAPSSFFGTAQPQLSSTKATECFKFGQEALNAANGEAKPKSRKSRRSKKVEEESEDLDSAGGKRRRHTKAQKNSEGPVTVSEGQPVSGGSGSGGIFGKGPEPAVKVTESSQGSAFGRSGNAGFFGSAKGSAVEEKKSAFGNGSLFGRAPEAAAKEAPLKSPFGLFGGPPSGKAN